MVNDDKEVVDHVNSATQMLEVYPETLRGALHDIAASTGVQRITGLGRASETRVGLPHDGSTR
jgi:hypothetical protein